jgi:hypothetical protein
MITAVRGKTWDPLAHGAKRLTSSGWIATVLATLGLGLSLAVTALHRRPVSERPKETARLEALAAVEARLAVEGLISPFFEVIVATTTEFREIGGPVAPYFDRSVDEVASAARKEDVRRKMRQVWLSEAPPRGFLYLGSSWSDHLSRSVTEGLNELDHVLMVYSAVLDEKSVERLVALRHDPFLRTCTSLSTASNGMGVRVDSGTLGNLMLSGSDEFFSDAQATVRELRSKYDIAILGNEILFDLTRMENAR